MSPDGRVIVFEESPYRPDNPGSSALLIVNGNGTRERPLGVRGFDAQFLRDGSIVFLSGEPMHHEVWTVNQNGSGRRRLSNNDGEKSSLCLTSRGTTLLFLRRVIHPGMAVRTPYTLFEINVDGTHSEEIVELW
jgi:Tol biopolymer transport system component